MLLDFGPHPKRKLFHVNAVFFLIVGVNSSVAAWSHSKLVAVGGPIFGITFALYWVVMGTGRLQIRETGIWAYWGLMRWQKIGSYSWARDGTLLLRGKGWYAAWFGGALPVAPEHKEAIDELLQRHCSATPVA